jgi:TIR domain
MPTTCSFQHGADIRMMGSFDRALEVVISYSHKDEALKNELLIHLSPLRREGVIRDWHDRDIDAGTEWKTEIDSHFKTADIILLLVSPDFIHSDYCYDIEMKKALERHGAGECRVIPIFLRACDWKGAPFGKLQGLPDDAIPVVSTQWGSRDDAFLRVAKGIRRVAEKLREKSPEMVPTSGKARDISVETLAPEPAVPTESIDDSGPGVLLNDKYFETEAVVEKEHDHFEIRVAAVSAEEEAELRTLRGDDRFQQNMVSFAHGNDGFIADVHAVRSESSGSRRVWIVELRRRQTHSNPYDDVSFNNVTAEQIREMRARLILLGEIPSAQSNLVPTMVRGFTLGRREQEIDGKTFPRLWAQVSGDIVKFLRFARLSAVFLLKATSTCDDILELRLGPVRNGRLHVKFRGRRKERWSGDAMAINVEGDCALYSDGTVPKQGRK